MNQPTVCDFFLRNKISVKKFTLIKKLLLGKLSFKPSAPTISCLKTRMNLT
jgi:hypothetical protein